MKNRVFGIFSIIIGLYLIISSSRSIITMLSAGKRIDEANNKYLEINKQNEALKKKLAEVKTKDYVEKIAREELNMSKKDESLVILPSSVKNPEVKKEIPPEKNEVPNWKKWQDLFFY